MKKLIISLSLLFLTFNIFAMDNETFIAKVKEIASCDTETEKLLSNNNCNIKNRKQNALCKSQLHADRADLFCETISKRSSQIQSYLYKQAAKFSDDEKQYQSIIEKINQVEASRVRDLMKWIDECVDAYQSRKANLESIGELQSEIEMDNRKRQAVRQLSKDLKSLELVFPKQPTNQTFQFHGGPPITCTTLNGFTSCN